MSSAAKTSHPSGCVNLVGLPAEVLQQICVLCNEGNHGRDVRILSLCCRSLREVVMAYTFPVRSKLSSWNFADFLVSSLLWVDIRHPRLKTSTGYLITPT